VLLEHRDEGWIAELHCETTMLAGLGMAKEKAPRPGLQAKALCSAKVVAGAGFVEGRTKGELRLAV